MELVYNIDYEVAGAVFTLVLIFALRVYYSDYTDTNVKFKQLVLFNLAAELMDIISAVTISYGRQIPSVLNVIVNTIYFMMVFSLGYTLFRYVRSYVISDKSMQKHVLVNKIVYLVLLGILVLNMFFGFLFHFNEAGEYIHGRLYLLVYFSPIFFVVYSAVILVKKRLFFSLKQKISISIYMSTIILGPAIQVMFFQNILLSSFTSSVALLIILFSMETPDYRLLIKTLAELDDLRKNLEKEVKKRTKVAEKRKEKVERISEQIILTLAKTIDAKDTYTNGHSERVAEYAREIARRMGKSEEEQLEIYHMGLLHDIGKIGVPDAVINKPGKLTDEEFQMITRHPEIGEEILKTISEFPTIAVGAKYHHERYDGTGYPNKLKGEDIPFSAMIIGIADAYDAMTSKRSYRDTLSQQVVRDEIEKGRGTQFHPECVDIMLQMIDEDEHYQMREH